jgi:hypothetical protein
MPGFFYCGGPARRTASSDWSIGYYFWNCFSIIAVTVIATL